MRTVIAITLGVALLSFLSPSQDLYLRLPLVDHTGAPLAGQPVEVLVEGPTGTEVIRAIPGPEGVLVEELHVPLVQGLTVSAAGYLPTQVTDLRTVEAREEGRLRIYLVPEQPVRLAPLWGAGIPWSSARRLDWADFQGPPPPDLGQEGARIHIVVSYWMTIAVEETESGFLAFVPTGGLTTGCLMDSIRSWVRPTAKIPELLAHEQGHFDLAEVYRRLLESTLRGLTELRSTPGEAKAALEARAAAAAQAILGRMEAAQARYDQETCHGLDEEAQARWLTMIETWLARPELAP